ncbi:hypothetical protein FRB94_001620 [Tulasnella sp. JGI-2019a]|nr:hypothetical protein FRB94_001620 [Tulasnella sp. JGI-2019a]
MPATWIQALAAVEAQGLIPNITQTNAGVYPKGVDPTSKEICNAAAQCVAPGDIWNAPDGMLGVSFDDGPTQYSSTLYTFLKSQNQIATHFFIGTNIKSNVAAFTQAYTNGDEIACHTWSHPWMTSLTNAQIVAELGWTQQIISDMTGGRIPKFWRPPMGDSDNRVRAIAQHVFGLQQVDWNQDTADWTIGLGKITEAGIESAIAGFLNLPKSPGLIILEHELYAGTVEAFINSYPLMKSKGWDTRSIGNLFNEAPYQNSDGDGASVPVFEQNLIPNATGTVSGLATSGAVASASSSTATATVTGTTATTTQASSATTTASKSAGLARYDVAGLFFKCLLAAPLIGVAHIITLA